MFLERMRVVKVQETLGRNRRVRVWGNIKGHITECIEITLWEIKPFYSPVLANRHTAAENVSRGDRQGSFGKRRDIWDGGGRELETGALEVQLGREERRAL